MQAKKLRVVVLFGGRSAEHEVSIESARSVLAALDPQRYEALPVAITPSGRWLPPQHSRALLAGGPVLGQASAAAVPPVEGGALPCAAEDIGTSNATMRGSEHQVAPGASPNALPATVSNQLPEASAGLREAEVVIPLVHGTYGEDGTLQGVLEFAGVPYVGAGVAASAVGMDKHLMKMVLRAAGLPVLDWLLVERHSRQRDPAGVRRLVQERIGYPCFVKPSNMGSSVGVHKVQASHELDAALNDADRYDPKVLVERAAQAPREIECSVLGNHDPIASLPGEIVPEREFYDYRAKYLEDSSELRIPAPLTPEQTERVRQLSLAAFRTLDCAGMARVDLFLEGGTLWLNEINTIPGFTRISMYPKLWEASGVTYAQLLDRLIALAIERHAERRGLVTHYEPAPVVAD
jgi:D-alanine-D-alanine ligase